LGRILALESMERGSVRVLGRRHGLSRQKVMDMLHEAASSAPTSAEVSSALRPKWSGVLTVDGKRVRVSGGPACAPRAGRMVWLCGVDAGTGDLQAHHPVHGLPWRTEEKERKVATPAGWL